MEVLKKKEDCIRGTSKELDGLYIEHKIVSYMKGQRFSWQRT